MLELSQTSQDAPVTRVTSTSEGNYSVPLGEAFPCRKPRTRSLCQGAVKISFGL